MRFVPSPSASFVLLFAAVLAGAPLAPAQGGLGLPPEFSPLGDPNSPGLLDPVRTALTETGVRLPASHQVDAVSDLLNLVGTVRRKRVRGETSATGMTIARTEGPVAALESALEELEDAAKDARVPAMLQAARRIESIVLGTTSGDLFDGFPLLGANTGPLLTGQVAGEHRMKVAADLGLRKPGIDGRPRAVWEVSVSLLLFAGDLHADAHLVRLPEHAHPHDTLRVHYRVYAASTEDLAPTAILSDARAPDSNRLPSKGLDATWVRARAGDLTEFSVDFPTVGDLDAVRTWGWRGGPARTSTMRLAREIRNAHTGALEFDPRSRSLTERLRDLDLASIGNAAPQKKALQVARATLAGAAPGAVHDALTRESVQPLGTAQDWVRTLERRDELPAEAWAVLAAEGITPGAPGGRLGRYEIVVAYANHEAWVLRAGDDPNGAGKIAPSRLLGARPGDRFDVKVVNLDPAPHYMQVVELGPELHDDIENCHEAPAGSHSLELFSHKPLAGAPKEAELQWRLGWGYRPHWNVIEQYDVFPRPVDRAGLQGFLDGESGLRFGRSFPADLRGGDFRFDPPPEAIGTRALPTPERLRELDGTPGLTIGARTEGFGVAKLCTHAGHPLGDWCRVDRSAFNPYGTRNVDTNGDQVDDVLWFPPWLRNPDALGGDVIESTLAWEPFLYLHPDHGGLLLDPGDPAQGWWSDLSYAHGAPVPPLGDGAWTVVAQRGLAQAIVLVDDLHAATASVTLSLEND